jgi:hypothetical protein
LQKYLASFVGTVVTQPTDAESKRRKTQQYVDKRAEYFEHRYRRQQIGFHKKKESKFRFRITLAQT